VGVPASNPKAKKLERKKKSLPGQTIGRETQPLEKKKLETISRGKRRGWGGELRGLKTKTFSTWLRRYRKKIKLAKSFDGWE